MNYEKIYNDIISKAKSEDRKKVKGGVYYEAHHIIPRCMGGEGMTYQHNHPNIILLTPKEHYMTHKLLCEIYPTNNKLRIAMWCMINGLSRSRKRYIPSCRIYSQLREEYSLSTIGRIHSEETKKKLSNSNKGKSRPPVSEATRKKLSNSSKGKLHTEETKKKLSSMNTGKVLSEETKKKLSSINKGKLHSEETKKKLSDAAKLHYLNKKV